jgi:DNA-binding NtrC family response regulator
MIRLVLYSPDAKLQSLLASALKSEYEVVLESRKERLKDTVRESGADILVLDFDSNYSSLEQQLEFFNQLGEWRIPTVVMTDDLRRSTATEFMQRGAHDCYYDPAGAASAGIGPGCIVQQGCPSRREASDARGRG